MVKKVVCNDKVGLFVGGHTGNYSGREIAADLVVGLNSHYAAIIFGWGYDDFVPLRPWPQLWLKRHTPRGNITSGFAWCGFFLTIGQ